jgi:hypothetical protein
MSAKLVRRRCLAFRVAVFLGIILCLFNAAGRLWAATGVAIALTLFAGYMARRTCRAARELPYDAV